MKVILALVIALLLLIPCKTQDNNDAARTPDETYTRKLVGLLSGLQKNPWLGWKSGTEVVVRYLIDSDAAGTPLGYAQPDIIYTVGEADKLLIVTQLFKGKTHRREFLIKDQPGIESAWPKVTETSTTDIELDGFKLTSLLSELTMNEFPGGTIVTRQWTLASDPSIVMRKELVGANIWRVTSARVIKKIGEREFQCVEIRKTMRFYSKGPAEDMTTQYLSPEVPGHLVEEIKEFFKVKKGQRSSSPFQVVHQKVVELKLQNSTRN